MKVQNIVRKAVAIGSAAGFVGATVMGAMAYDLSTYPTKFVVDGKFDGKIIIGEKAATTDVLGAIDIATSIQGAAITKKPVTSGGGATTVSLSGDVKQIGTGSDKLELREPVGKVTDTLTNSDLQALKGGKLTTAEGTTDYAQYLRFSSNVDSSGVAQTSNQLQPFGVNFIDDRNSKLGDYLVMEQTDKPVFEWQMQFSNGLKSKVDSDGRMRDIEDRTLNILGTDFSVVKATVDSAGKVDIVMMGGSVADTLREGETKTYTINGVDYDVTLVFVSDPSSASSGPAQVKFSVNGEITKALQRSDTDTLSGGVQIGIRDILVNAREGVASFFLGANKIEFGPVASTTDAFSTGRVQINNQNINEAQLSIRGDNYASSVDSNNIPTKYEITSIKYRLKMNAKSNTDVYMPSGQGLRENLRFPQGLISPTLDVTYQGLTMPAVKNIAFNPRGNDQYSLQFTNLLNQDYNNVYLLSNRNSVFKFGTDNYDFIMVEALNSTQQNIGLNDYFVVSDSSRSDQDKSTTAVLRYIDVDTTNKVLRFNDEATGATREVTFTVGTTTTGAGNLSTGDLIVGGRTFKVYLENGDNASASHRLAIDMDASGTVSPAVIPFTVLGGGVLTLSKIEVAATNGTLTQTVKLNNATAFAYVDGDGKNVSSAAIPSSQTNNTNMTGGSLNLTGTATLYWSLKTLAKNFDTSGGADEFINWTIAPVNSPSARVQLAQSSVLVSGPLTNNTAGAPRFQQFRFTTDVGDSQNYKGMSDFGVSILDNVPSSGTTPETLTLGYPSEQRLAQVFVVGGTTTSSTSTSGSTTDVINPIAVGLAVLDRDASGWIGKENLIVVGGPCANTVAADLLGNPTDCTEGFEAGKAMIKSWDKNGKTAILVAGYSATDTQGASRVLASYKDYQDKLKGSEVEVVVADLNSIQVKAPSSMAATTTTTTA